MRKERPECNGERLTLASASPFSGVGRGNAQSTHPAKECIQVKELGSDQENDIKSSSVPRSCNVEGRSSKQKETKAGTRK